jgi:hypothetical protein
MSYISYKDNSTIVHSNITPFWLIVVFIESVALQFATEAQQIPSQFNPMVGCCVCGATRRSIAPNRSISSHIFLLCWCCVCPSFFRLIVALTLPLSIHFGHLLLPENRNGVGVRVHSTYWCCLWYLLLLHTNFNFVSSTFNFIKILYQLECLAPLVVQGSMSHPLKCPVIKHAH